MHNRSPREYEKDMKVSVVVTSFNQEKYLPDAIESLLRQTVRPYEIIICDDCSTKDETLPLITAYANRYRKLIKPILQKQNLGIAANRNAGFKAAKGDLITWLDGDDRFLPNKIEKELKVLSNYRADIAYSNVYVTDENFKRLGTRYKQGEQLDGDIFDAIVTRRLPPPLMMMVPKKCFNEVGFLDEELKIYEDWEWKIRLASRFLFVSCSEPLYEYRQHKDGAHNLPRSIHIETMNKILVRALSFCDVSMVSDKDETKRNIGMFIATLQVENMLLLEKRSELTAFVRKFLDTSDQKALLVVKTLLAINNAKIKIAALQYSWMGRMTRPIGNIIRPLLQRLQGW